MRISLSTLGINELLANGNDQSKKDSKSSKSNEKFSWSQYLRKQLGHSVSLGHFNK
ncbi:MAG: hypothetical protein NXI20_09705 [bacterium]|nr:hypothetical protein [bacterium]